MIYICTASYFEGEYFIKSLSLKKDNSVPKFQIFKGNTAVLIITGTGKVRAASAVTYLFSNCEPGPDDILINYGICGAANDCNISLYNTYLINKILDRSTDKTFFTDILYRNPFEEKSIETVDKPLLSSRDSLVSPLCDMECSGIYQSAVIFISTDQIYIIKTVSDFLNSDIDISSLKKHIESASDNILQWALNLNSSISNKNETLSPKETELIEEIASSLKFSEAMKIRFKKELLYNKLSHGMLPDFLYSYKNIKCSSKKEGKAYAREIESKLL